MDVVTAGIARRHNRRRQPHFADNTTPQHTLNSSKAQLDVSRIKVVRHAPQSCALTINLSYRLHVAPIAACNERKATISCHQALTRVERVLQSSDKSSNGGGRNAHGLSCWKANDQAQLRHRRLAVPGRTRLQFVFVLIDCR
ncbi:hypothetical protein [Rhodopseudomonas palustris]|uniref:Uncharacterized protein n=1 Tax=Rhodopseudomonas palustris (strain BisB18) TaxID=316056 RepID=Q217A0_RHOPB